MTGIQTRYAKPGQFQVVRKDGIAWVNQQHDQAFRKALIDGCPPQVRAKMHEALAATPGPGAAGHSKRYFGAELPSILKRCGPLIDELDVFMVGRLNLSGFKDWLTVTNFGNDYRMIKAMTAWADMVYAREDAEKKAASVH